MGTGQRIRQVIEGNIAHINLIDPVNGSIYLLIEHQIAYQQQKGSEPKAEEQLFSDR